MFHPINEIGYQIQPRKDDGPGGILYRRLDYFIDEEPMRGGRLEVLYDHVVSFQVRFFDGLEWHEDWIDERAVSLPRAVQVILGIAVPLEGAGEDARYREREYDFIVFYPQGVDVSEQENGPPESK